MEQNIETLFFNIPEKKIISETFKEEIISDIRITIRGVLFQKIVKEVNPNVYVTKYYCLNDNGLGLPLALLDCSGIGYNSLQAFFKVAGLFGNQIT
jgi:hypothetical protein